MRAVLAKRTTVRAITGVYLAASLALAAASGIDEEGDFWHFTPAEMEVAYRYQQKFGERPANPLRARGCLLGQPEFVATYKGRRFAVPCRFIKETIRHLAEALTLGAARYLFALDLGHAHLLLPARVWETKYAKESWGTAFAEILREPELAVLYHSAENLSLSDRSGRVDPAAKAWKEKRNILAFYDGRPIRILPPGPEGMGVGPPEPYVTVGGFNIVANPQGNLNIFLGRQIITFDLSFEIGVSELEETAYLPPPGATSPAR